MAIYLGNKISEIARIKAKFINAGFPHKFINAGFPSLNDQLDSEILTLFRHGVT